MPAQAPYSAEKFKLFTEKANDFILTHVNGIITFVNEAGLRSTGYRPDEIVGRNVLDFISKESMDVARQNLESRKLGDKKSSIYEVNAIKKDGGLLPIEISSTPIVQDGDTNEILIIARDLSERNSFKSRVEEVTHAFRTMAENIQEGMIIFENLKLTYANSHVQRITGFTLGELMRANMKDFFMPDDITRFLDIVARIGKDEQWSGEDYFWIVTKDGSRRYVRAYYTSQLRQQDSVVYVVISDETEHRQLLDNVAIQLDLALELNEESDLQRLLGVGLGWGMKVSQMECGGVYLTERGGGLTLAIHRNLSEGFIEKVKAFPRESWNVQLLLSGKPIFEAIPSLAQEQEKLVLFKEEGLLSIASIPIMHEGQLIAALNLASRKLVTMPGNTQKLVEILAANMAGSIIRARVEENYKILADNAQEMIIIFDMQDRVLFANRAAEHLLGFSKDELQHVNVMALVPSRYMQLINERRQLRSQGDKGANHYELEITNKQGRRIPISMTSTPVMKEGKMEALLVVARDITARKEIESNLEKVQEQYGFIIENADDLITILDERGKFEWVNGKAHQKLLGYSPDELIGTYPVKYTHPDDRQILMQEFRKGMERGFFKLDFRFCPKNGGPPVWLEAFGRSFVRDDTKKIISISRDISKQKEMEKLKDEEMERLKQLDEMRKSFVSNATHELKTPLSSVLGAAEFLKGNFSGTLPKPAVRMLDLIVSGSRRLKSLIDHILDFSRVQMNKLELQKELADMVDIIKRVARDMNYLAEQKGLVIRVEEAPADARVECDAFRIEQVVNNLLSNAIKNTENGASIIIRVQEQAGAVIVSVIDEGIGITGEEMHNLFTPFGKFERDHVNVDIQGTGLGLYISKQIIDLHGGKIWAESGGRGKGSTFSFTLPRDWHDRGDR